MTFSSCARDHDGRRSGGSRGEALRGVGCWLALLGALACGQELELGRCDATAEACQSEVRIATWWGVEASYLTALSQNLNTETTLTWVPSQTTGIGKTAHVNFVTAALSRPEPVPFDALLLNNGLDVYALAGCNDAGPESLLPLNREFSETWVADAFPAPIVETLTCDNGNLYALPVGLHQINHVVYNAELFRRLSAQTGLPPPGQWSFEDLVGASEALAGLMEGSALEDGAAESSAGEGVATESNPSDRGAADADAPATAGAQRSVFAVPDEDDMFSLFFIENVMFATAGGVARSSGEQEELYASFWRGEASGAERLVERTLDNVLRLSPFFNSDPIDNRDVALDRVKAGQAAMMVIGDWVLAGEVERDERLGSMTFPGTQDHWMVSADVFAVPNREENRLRGVEWLAAALQREPLRAFTEAKYATSAETELIGEERLSRLVLSLPGRLARDQAFGELSDRLGKWVRGGYESTPSMHAYLMGQYREVEARRKETESR